MSYDNSNALASTGKEDQRMLSQEEILQGVLSASQQAIIVEGNPSGTGTPIPVSGTFSATVPGVALAADLGSHTSTTVPATPAWLAKEHRNAR